MKKKKELKALPSKVEGADGESAAVCELTEKELQRFYEGVVGSLKRQMGEYFARNPAEWEKLKGR